MVGQNLSVGEKAKSSEKDLKGCKDKNGLSPKIYFCYVNSVVYTEHTATVLYHALMCWKVFS